MQDSSTQTSNLDLAAVSGIAGSISIACWVVVFSPQIVENFRRSSAEGLSIPFIVIWLVGDVFNILGGVLQGILPTMLILAWYYTFADVVLLLQCFYYRGLTLSDKPMKPSDATSPAVADEQTALLPSNDILGTTSRRSSSAIREHLTTTFTNDGMHLSPAVPVHSNRDMEALKARSPILKRTTVIKSVLFNATALVVVCAAGVSGWYISQRATSHQSHHHDAKSKHADSNEDNLAFSLWGQIFGYVCAVLYLGSRVPQLLLNYRRKSTEGVSMLFFLFAVVGNATYVLSIFAYETPCSRSTRHGCGDGQATREYWQYVLVNLSWLLGSAGTLLLDCVVFVQWFWYREGTEEAVE